MHNRFSVSLLVFTMVVTGASVVANATDDPQDAALKFIQTRLLNKKLKLAERVRRIESQNLESVFSSTRTVISAAPVKFGFYFDVETDIHQKLYRLDKNGKRMGDPEVTDRSFINRFYVSQRRSTNELVVYSFPIKDGKFTHVDEFPFSMSAGRLTMGNDTLTIHLATVVYEDLYGKEPGKFRPGATDSTTIFEVVDGHVQRRDKTNGYDVDVKTLEKRLSDDLPEDISVEAAE